MISKALSRLEPLAYTALRVAAGAMFSFHGAQKVLGVFGAQPRPFGSQLWIGGMIELVAGVLVAVGLFTRVAAFLASGTMAVAYVQFHWKLGLAEWKWLPAINKGELAALYCFAFLYIATRGPGAGSVDRRMGRG